MSPGSNLFTSLTTFLRACTFSLVMVFLMILRELIRYQKVGIGREKQSGEMPVGGNQKLSSQVLGSLGNRLQGAGSLPPEIISGSVVRKRTPAGPAPLDPHIFLQKITCACLL